jgi:hypothetical protein
MKLTKNNNRYMQIRLYNNESKSKIFRVHQLVAYMFVENKDNTKYVDRIDRNRINNHFRNLKWVTHQENMCNTNKNNFIKIGIINNINYSNYLINEDGDITNIKGKLRKTAINNGYSCIALILII